MLVEIYVSKENDAVVVEEFDQPSRYIPIHEKEEEGCITFEVEGNDITSSQYIRLKVWERTNFIQTYKFIRREPQTVDAPQAEPQPSTTNSIRLEVGFHSLHFEENIQVVRLHFPDISHIDFNAKTATFAIAGELTQEQEDWLHFAEFEGHYIASHEVQDTPQPDVLYEDTYRRVVKLASDYQYGISDTILELAESGYTSHLVSRNEQGTSRIFLNAKMAKILVAELEAWEKEHGDAHPF